MRYFALEKEFKEEAGEVTIADVRTQFEAVEKLEERLKEIRRPRAPKNGKRPWPSDPERSRIPLELRMEVLERDGFRCVQCGRTAYDVPLQIDHKQPRSLGGSDELDNLQVLCADCNRSKGASLPEG